MVKKGKTMDVWNEKAGKGFEEIKKMLTYEPVLGNPDYSCSFFIQTNAMRRI